MTTTIASPMQQIARSEGPPDPYLVKIRDLIYQVAGIFQPDNNCVSSKTAVSDD